MFVEHKEQGEVKEAPAKTLRLSEAIRIGASMRPQTKPGECGPFSRGHSCALGAAYEAIGGQYSGTMSTTPVCDALAALGMFGTREDELVGSIIIKNDHGGWTRERIADWLEAQGY